MFKFLTSPLFLTAAVFSSSIPFMPNASAAELSASGTRMSWFNFRLQQLSVLQAEGASYSGLLSWNPEYRLTERFSAGLGMGGSVLKGKSTEFAALEFTLGCRYQFTPVFSTELLSGTQIWVGNGGTQFLAGLNASYHFDDRPFKVIERVVAGYATLLSSGRTTHEVKIGLGFGI